MRDRELYATILGIVSPWQVRDVELRAEGEQVEVFVGHDGRSQLKCPQCGRASPRYDERRRSWRHLDTCQYRTVLTADVPRVKCAEHGVHQVQVDWAEPGSRFTALFECVALDWLREANISAVARRLKLSWDELDGIQARAVARGMQRRKVQTVTHVGVDETSFQRRHEYVTLVCDLKANGRVLHVADNRGQAALWQFYDTLSEQQREAIEVVTMDMWHPYIEMTKRCVPGWEHKLCFDRFHVAEHLGEAINAVRAREHRELMRQGDERLKRTRFWWLMSPDKLSRLNDERTHRFDALRRSNLKVARAWAIKETARGLWHYRHRGWALRAWKRWLGWALRSRLAPIQKVARMIRHHLWGVINAIVHRANNATTEAINAKIQWVKKSACGFRNRERFRAAIMFHCGGLDMKPHLTHTNA